MMPRTAPAYEVPDLGDPVLDMIQPDSSVDEAGSLCDPFPSASPADLAKLRGYATVSDLQSSSAPGSVTDQARLRGYATVSDLLTSSAPVSGADQARLRGYQTVSDLGAAMQSGRSELVRDAPDPLGPASSLKWARMRDEHRNETAHGVKYIWDVRKRRQKYEVTIDATMLRRGQVFDTARIKALYFHKLGYKEGADLLTAEEKGNAFKVKPRAEPAIASMGADSGSQHAANYWGKKSLIWVCAPDGGFTTPSFYSHIGKMGKFHHSSLKAGDDVICAGEWIVDKGKLLKISGNSGHYRPTLDHLHAAVLRMAKAFHPETVVLLWHVLAGKWEEVPVLKFKQSPSGNGMYKVHPTA